MNELDAIKTEYDNQIRFHKKSDFCHSIDKESYRIQCKTFFSKQSNSKLSIALAEESNMLCEDCENDFLLWLNRE